MGDNESYDGGKKSQSSCLIFNDGRFRSIDHAAHVDIQKVTIESEAS